VTQSSRDRSPDPIDEAVLEGLCHLHPDHRPDIAKNLVMMFVETSPLVLQHLEEAAAQNDAGALRRESHILVSSSAAVGARLLSSECKDLEESAIMGSVPDGAARVRAITRLCEEAEIALRAWCAGRG
jgi:HPt (histidine-containing phosphotransfer) domain-containing protein